MIDQLIAAGVDAVIIQDLGLARLTHDTSPTFISAGACRQPRNH
jgi:collagenase-like PrtC family protease